MRKYFFAAILLLLALAAAPMTVFAQDSLKVVNDLDDWLTCEHNLPGQCTQYLSLEHDARFAATAKANFGDSSDLSRALQCTAQEYRLQGSVSEFGYLSARTPDALARVGEYLNDQRSCEFETLPQPTPSVLGVECPQGVTVSVGKDGWDSMRSCGPHPKLVMTYKETLNANGSVCQSIVVRWRPNQGKHVEYRYGIQGNTLKQTFATPRRANSITLGNCDKDLDSHVWVAFTHVTGYLTEAVWTRPGSEDYHIRLFGE